MKIIVDKSAGALYMYLNSESVGKPGVVKKTVTADENVNIDYDENDKLVGIEILSLNILNLDDLKKVDYSE